MGSQSCYAFKETRTPKQFKSHLKFQGRGGHILIRVPSIVLILVLVTIRLSFLSARCFRAGAVIAGARSQLFC